MLSYIKVIENMLNSIQNAEYSIDCGIHCLSDCLKEAKHDMSYISLALQGYNFGSEYITEAAEHFEGYTRANAKVFSNGMKKS